MIVLMKPTQEEGEERKRCSRSSGGRGWGVSGRRRHASGARGSRSMVSRRIADQSTLVTPLHELGAGTGHVQILCQDGQQRD